MHRASHDNMVWWKGCEPRSCGQQVEVGRTLQAMGRVGVGHLHLNPRRCLAQQRVYLVPQLRSRSPGSGGRKRVVVSLGVPIGDHDQLVVIGLDEWYRAFVAGQPFCGRFYLLAPEPDRLVEVAGYSLTAVPEALTISMLPP
jgi:hypothetical protein